MGSGCGIEKGIERGVERKETVFGHRLASYALRFTPDCNLCSHLRMPTARLSDIVRHCDKLLRTAEVNDWDRAHNGLQVENDGRITRIAAAVDASPATVKLAIAAKADLLIVHHGLF